MVEIFSNNNGYTNETIGLTALYGFELSASIDDLALKNECKKFISFVADYISDSNTIHSGDTLRYGYWLTKAVLNDQKKMVFLEYSEETKNFLFGINNTLRYWKEQHKICQKFSANYTPPWLEQMIVISEGVYEGDAVDGVRYPSPEHMSGWWLTTAKYNGKIDSLKIIHARHVTARRPDLVKYIALPYGFRFYTSKDQERVWFDKKILNEKT